MTFERQRRSSTVADHLGDARDYGFTVTHSEIDWAKLKQSRDAYVSRLNDIYRRRLDTGLQGKP